MVRKKDLISKLFKKKRKSKITIIKVKASKKLTPKQIASKLIARKERTAHRISMRS